MIRDARYPDDGPALRGLFEAYAATIDVPFCRDELEDEIAAMDTRPGGGARYWLVVGPGERGIGCVGLKPLDAARAELVRLYVDPAHRGAGLGQRLVSRVVDHGRRAGHAQLVLHTLPQWTAACALYRAAGFDPIAPYRPVPDESVLFLGASLAAPD